MVSKKNLKDGWYMCKTDEKEIPLFYKNGKWYLSAYDVLEEKDESMIKPTKVLNRMSK